MQVLLWSILLLIFYAGVKGYYQRQPSGTNCPEKIRRKPCKKDNGLRYLPPVQPDIPVITKYIQMPQLVTPVFYKPMPMPYRRPSPLLAYIKFLILQKLIGGVTLPTVLSPAPTVLSPAPTKPAKWWMDPYHCKYHYQSKAVSYDDAVAYCGRIGGKLAAGLWRSHYYFEENLASKIILDLVPRSVTKTSFWIGIRYVRGDINDWVYTDGVVVNDDRVNGLDCKVVFTVDDGFEINFEYIDDTCEGKHPFICEYC